MAVATDLRAFHRYPGDGIVARIEEETVGVIDVSLAGIRVVRPRNWSDSRDIEFVLNYGPETEDLSQSIPVRGQVVGQDSAHLRIAFRAVSPALADIIDDFMERHMVRPVSDYSYKLF